MQTSGVQPAIEPYVTTVTVARFLDKPLSWIHNNAERLGMPVHKIGKQWRWKLSEVDAWVTGKRIATEPQAPRSSVRRATGARRS